MKKILLFVLVVLATSALAQEAIKTIFETKNIEVKQGKAFVIALEANPTTGYMWSLAQPLDEKAVKLVKEKYTSQSNLVGAGGVDRWEFKALTKGQTKIVLKYSRAWEKKIPPLQLYTYKIKII